MSYLSTAENAARTAGALLRENFETDIKVDEALHHDLKIALDKESQELITRILLDAYPTHAIYGEEGLAGDQSSDYHWIVDPIDGTVNFYYGIPHFCVSIALRHKEELIAGIIYDPMMNELWAVEKDGKPTLNGREIAASSRTKLEESVLFVGCGKTEEALNIGLERFKRASLRARKMRMMGSAALAMAYIATGRLDGYVESRISLWDIAAGQLLLQQAGGQTTLTPKEGEPDVWSIVATNAKIPINEIL